MTTSGSFTKLPIQLQFFVFLVNRHFAIFKWFGLGVARNPNESTPRLNLSRPAVDFCPNGTVRGHKLCKSVDVCVCVCVCEFTVAKQVGLRCMFFLCFIFCCCWVVVPLYFASVLTFFVAVGWL